MSKYNEHFNRELEILRKNATSELVIEDFIPEINSIIEKFSKQEHSGMSASYYSQTIGSTIQKLLMFDTISPIYDEYWKKSSFGSTQQNIRCGSLFKDEEESRAHYIDAIVWCGEEEYDSYTGHVDGISSSQYVKFPFNEQKFYIDVIRVYDTKENVIKSGKNWSKDNYSKKGVTKYYTTEIKDYNQFLEVSEVFDMIDSENINNKLNKFLKDNLRIRKLNNILKKD